MRAESYTHEFADSLPEASCMDERVLCVCIEYSVAAHLCMCGCGAEVVTPFSPARWTMSFDGRSVSLNPSVGNWGSPCESHYWLKSGDVRWSRHFSKDEVAVVRRKDQADLDAGAASLSGSHVPTSSDSGETSSLVRRAVLLIRRLFAGG